MQTSANPYEGDEGLSQNDLDELVCNMMRSGSFNIPDNVNFVKNSGASFHTAWGIAVSGV